MATRGMIARKKTDYNFEGRYHHWDSYPEGLGETLCKLYQGHFKRDVATMLHVLIDEHPAGWSTIVDRDFTREPGFRAGPDDDRGQPQCYCHGARHEESYLYTSLPAGWTDIEYAYVIDENAVMTVYHHCLIGRHTYTWEVVKTVNMNEWQESGEERIPAASSPSL